MHSLDINKVVLTKVLISLIIIIIFWIIKRSLLKIVNKKVKETHSRYLWRKALNYIVIAADLIFIGAIWMKSFQSLATYLGLLSAGISIALKDPILDMAGWLFIVTHRILKVGDRIEIDGKIGDVIDTGIFQFLIIEVGEWVDADQSTGRIIHIPNSLLFTKPLINYTKGFPYIWNEIPVLVTFESNWKKAKTLLQKIVQKHTESSNEIAKMSIKKAARKFDILYQHTEPRVYTSVENSGILLTIRYLCRVRKRRGTAEAIWEDILDEFAKHNDIDLAYPTQRFFNNAVEGKSGTRPKQ